MASRDGHSNTKAAVALNTAALNGIGATAGNIIDTNGFESVEFLVHAGAITSGSVTATVEEGDAADLSDTAAATKFHGSIALTKSPDDSNTVERFGYAGHRQYVRLSLNKTGTHAFGTATLVADLAVTEKVTIESTDFVCKAKYATATVAFDTLVADNVVAIGGVTFTAKVDPGVSAVQFALGANDAAALVNLAAKVNAHSTVGLLVQMVGASGVVTAVTAGKAGNDVTITGTAVRVALTGTSGGKLSGAYDETPTANEWPLESTLALSATALAASINRSTTPAILGVVTASTTGTAVCTVTAVADGTDGNALTFAKTGAHITVTGSGTLTGGLMCVGTFGATCVLGHPRDLEPIP